MPAGQTLSDRLVAICPCFLLYHSWRHYDRFQLFCCRLQPFFCSIGSCTSSPLGASTALLPLRALCPFSWLHLLPDRHTRCCVTARNAALPIWPLCPFLPTWQRKTFLPTWQRKTFLPTWQRKTFLPTWQQKPYLLCYVATCNSESVCESMCVCACVSVCV